MEISAQSPLLVTTDGFNHQFMCLCKLPLNVASVFSFSFSTKNCQMYLILLWLLKMLTGYHFCCVGTSAGVGFAIPVDTVAKLVPQLIAFGKVGKLHYNSRGVGFITL